MNAHGYKAWIILWTNSCWHCIKWFQYVVKHCAAEQPFCKCTYSFFSFSKHYIKEKGTQSLSNVASPLMRCQDVAVTPMRYVPACLHNLMKWQIFDAAIILVVVHLALTTAHLSLNDCSDQINSVLFIWFICLSSAIYLKWANKDIVTHLCHIGTLTRSYCDQCQI